MAQEPIQTLCLSCKKVEGEFPIIGGLYMQCGRCFALSGIDAMNCDHPPFAREFRIGRQQKDDWCQQCDQPVPKSLRPSRPPAEGE